MNRLKSLMIRRYIYAFALTAAVLAGCGLTDSSDEPLPTVEQLRAAYAEQEPGTGTVREGENFRSGGYTVVASYEPTGEGTLRAYPKTILR